MSELAEDVQRVRLGNVDNRIFTARPYLQTKKKIIFISKLYILVKSSIIANIKLGCLPREKNPPGNNPPRDKTTNFVSAERSQTHFILSLRKSPNRFPSLLCDGVCCMPCKQKHMVNCSNSSLFITYLTPCGD